MVLNAGISGKDMADMVWQSRTKGWETLCACYSAVSDVSGFYRSWKEVIVGLIIIHVQFEYDTKHFPIMDCIFVQIIFACDAHTQYVDI